MNVELKLANTTEEVKAFFKEMLNISRRQLKLVENAALDTGIGDELQQLILERQSLEDKINRVRQLAEQYEKILKHGDSGGSISRQPGIYAGYIEQKTEIRDIITLIQANDNQTRVLLAKELNKAGQRLGKARENTKAFQLYNQAQPYSEAWFFDKKK